MAGLSLNSPLAGGAVLSPGAGGSHVSLNGVGFQVDLSMSSFVQGLTQDVDKASRETSIDERGGISPDVWRRYRDSWHYGQGQRKADKDDSIPYRYRSSLNIDPWTRWQFSMLNALEADDNDGKYDGKSDVVSYDNYSFCFKGSILFRVLRVGDAPAVWTEIQLPNQITSIDSDGEYILVANGPHVHRVLPVTMEIELWRDLTAVVGAPTWAWVAWTNGSWQSVIDNYSSWEELLTTGGGSRTISMVRWVKGRVIAASGDALYDLSIPTYASNGTVERPYSLIYQGTVSSKQVWLDACDGLSCVYLIGGSGQRWSVQRLMIADDGIVLEPPISTASLPYGEAGLSVNSYLGMLVVGSSAGARIAAMEPSGDLSLGQLVTAGGAVRCGMGYRRHMWVGSPRFPSPLNDEKTYSGLARVDLSRFTEQLTPAYANDLCLEGDGGVYGVSRPTSGIVVAIEGKGLCFETTRKASFGVLATGGFTFGSTEPKQGRSLAIGWDPLDGSVQALISGDDRSVAMDVGTYSGAGSTSSGVVPLPSVAAFRESEITIILRPDATGLLGPVVQSIDVRAVRVPGGVSDWVVPLLVREAVEMNGATIIRDCASDLKMLSMLASTAKPTVLRVGNDYWVVQATDYEWRPEEPTSRGDSWQGVFIIKLKEVG